MQDEIVQRLHQQKYKGVMTLQEYTKKVKHGLQLIRTSGLYPKDRIGSTAISLALEYNRELMVNFLGLSKIAM